MDRAPSFPWTERVSVIFPSRKHEIVLFPERFRVFPQRCHAFTLAETRVSIDGNLTETYKKKWWDSTENAATETRVNILYPLTKTCDCRHVSATVLRVYVKFPFTDFSNSVLCLNLRAVS